MISLIEPADATMAAPFGKDGKGKVLKEVGRHGQGLEGLVYMRVGAIVVHSKRSKE